MSALRSTVKRTVDGVRSHPSLLLGSLPLVAAFIILILITTYVDSVRIGPARFFGWCAVAWLVGAPVTTAMVEHAIGRTDETGLSPYELMIGLYQYPRLLARTLTTRLLALPLLVIALAFVGGIGLASLTGVQTVGYALGWWTFSRVHLSLFTILLVLLALGVAWAPLLFTNVEPLRERPLREAASTSVRAFMARPLSVTGTALIEVFLSLAPFVATVVILLTAERVVGDLNGIGFRVLGVIIVAVGVPLFGARAVFHEEAYRQITNDSGTTRPIAARLRSIGVGRVALIGLLLGGAVIGGVTVRIADERPGTQFVNSPDPVPTDDDIDADALVNRSFDRVKRVSHVSRYRQYNKSTGRVDHLTVKRVEYPDHEFEVYYIERSDENAQKWTVNGGYISATTIAQFLPAEVTTDGRPPNISTLRSDQTPRVSVVNHYPISPLRPETYSDYHFSRLKRGNWHVVSQSEGRVVLNVTNYSAVARRNPERIKNGSARVVVDADTGFVTRIEEQWTFTRGNETGSNRVVITHRRYETDTMARPPALGSQTPFQLLADVLFY